MKRIIILSSLLILAMSNCRKETSSGTPKCIEKKITKFTDHGLHNVKEYLFQNKTTYAFDYGSIVDGSIDIYSAKCKCMGTLRLQIDEDNINGEDFLANAELIEIIWEK